MSQIKFAALSCYRWVQGAGPILNNPAGWHSEQCESMGCCKYDVTICIHPDGTIDSPTYTQSSQAQCTPDCYNGCSFDDGWEQIGKIGVDSKEENGASLSTFTLTPNPSSGKMRMTMLVPEKGDYSLSISDMQGVTVYEETINAKSASVEKDLTLDKLVSGVYLYKVNFENKTCFTGKITIIK
ncbi:MAG: T9SS type A sorting domain-containing protein [Chloroflexota bacterium]